MNHIKASSLNIEARSKTNTASQVRSEKVEDKSENTKIRRNKEEIEVSKKDEIKKNEQFQSVIKEKEKPDIEKLNHSKVQPSDYLLKSAV